MENSHIYTKEEISKILNKASQIQTQKDLYGDQEGLSEEELVQLAKEVGIDRESLSEALITYNDPDLNEEYSWIKATSRIQNITTLNGDFTDEEWEQTVREIRRVTGGIGKINTVGKSFEWEQRRKEIGYRHFSFTPVNGKTKVQIVSSWAGLKRVAHMIGIIVPFAATAIVLDGTGISEIPSILICAAVGLITGLPLTRIYLKSYFNRQKKQIKEIISAVSKKLSQHSSEGKIQIEEEDLRSSENSASLSEKIRS